MYHNRDTISPTGWCIERLAESSVEYELHQLVSHGTRNQNMLYLVCYMKHNVGKNRINIMNTNINHQFACLGMDTV